MADRDLTPVVDDAATALDDLDRLRRRTRQARRACWFPLIVFGVVILLSAPLYRVHQTIRTSPGRVAAEEQSIKAFTAIVDPRGKGFDCLFAIPVQVRQCGLTAGQARKINELRAPISGLRIVTTQPSPRVATVYWAIVGTGAYLLTALFYRRRRLGRGVTTSVRSTTATGIGLLAAVAATTACGLFPLGHLIVREMVPLLAIGVGFVVLAAAERSTALAVIGVAFTALTADLEHPSRAQAPPYGSVQGLDASLEPIHLAVLGVFLVAAGVAFVAVERRTGATP